jgi:hypothetical protein
MSTRLKLTFPQRSMNEVIMHVSKLISVNTGNQVRLEDGTVFRVGLNYGEIVSTWEIGDEIEIADRSNPAFHVVMANRRTGDTVPAMISRNLSSY